MDGCRQLIEVRCVEFESADNVWIDEHGSGTIAGEDLIIERGKKKKKKKNKSKNA